MFSPKNILVPTDFSEASDRALNQALDIAEQFHSRIYLLHVIIPLPTISDMEFHPVIDQQELSESYLDEQEQLAGLVKQLVDVGVNATALIRQGDPVKSILSEARRLDAELIVVGSHGHGLLFDALVGSVSGGILRQTTLPVLIVPVRGI